MAEEVKASKESPKPILHVLVVGFHHKKGCQVEYSFPPLVEGDDPTACPAGWKYLPTLALPDGSHNFDEDAVYFHLPSLSDPKRTVYGISCYRQIPVERLKIRTADLTRSTVQKSVCVLSAIPLYGHIQVKMALITHAYFDEGDFSQVKLLHDTYHHLNSCMEQLGPLGSAPQLFVGLSARDLILQFGHKAVLLFKLLLLERRLVFYRSPVQPLCAAILTLLSLHPGMIEQGLVEAACVRPSRPMSPIPDFSDADEADYDNSNNAAKEDSEMPVEKRPTDSEVQVEKRPTDSEVPVVKRPTDSEVQVEKRPTDSEVQVEKRATDSEVQVDKRPTDSEVPVEKRPTDSEVPVERVVKRPTDLAYGSLECDEAREADIQGEGTEAWMEVSARLPVSESLGNFPGGGSDSNLSGIAQMSSELCGLPLPLFTQGNLCLPYLSLPYLDLLGDVNVRGYIVGATNVLFKQKKNLADVLVEVEGSRVETQDPDLRRQLHLTTEDLRFAEYVVRRVTCERHDVFLDGVGWEGGDEWIRAQFKAYALCLLRTSLLQDGCREMDHFNASFMTAWKATHNYRRWLSGEHNGIWDLNPGHPFAGQLSVADMKLRLSHTMQNTEGGRKLNQAMTSTGRAVATTGRAVGGAISQAKGALSSWWTTLTVTTQPPDNTEEDENVSPNKPAHNGNRKHVDNPLFVDDDPKNLPTILPSADVETKQTPSPTSSQLESHILPNDTKLTSLANIECGPTSLPPNGMSERPPAENPNRNAAYLKSEVVRVELSEVVLPKTEAMDSLGGGGVDPALDSAPDVLRIS